MQLVGGGAQNYQQWFNFLGLIKDKQPTGIGAPYQMDFPGEQALPEGMTAMKEGIPTCWDPAFKCSCGDCPDAPQCVPVSLLIVCLSRSQPNASQQSKCPMNCQTRLLLSFRHSCTCHRLAACLSLCCMSNVVLCARVYAMTPYHKQQGTVRCGTSCVWYGGVTLACTLHRLKCYTPGRLLVYRLQVRVHLPVACINTPRHCQTSPWLPDNDLPHLQPNQRPLCPMPALHQLLGLCSLHCTAAVLPYCSYGRFINASAKL